MADWRGFGQQLSSAFATSYLDALRRKQDEEQFNRQMKNVEADNLRQDINTYLTLSSKYRPVGQGDMQPVFGAGAPISLPPKEAISFSGLDPNSYLGIRLNDRFFVPREEPVEFDIKTIDKNVYQVPKGAPIDFNNPSYTIPTEEKATDPYLRVIQTERDGKYGDWGLRRDTNEWEFIGGDKPDKSGGKQEETIDNYLASLDQVISTVKNLKSYPTTRYSGAKQNSFLGIDWLSKDDELRPDEQGELQYVDTGAKELVESNIFRKTKIEPAKIAGTQTAIKLVRSTGIANAVSAVKEYMREGVNIDEAVNLVIKDNPLSEVQKTALKKYFEWANL